MQRGQVNISRIWTSPCFVLPSGFGQTASERKRLPLGVCLGERDCGSLLVGFQFPDCRTDFILVVRRKLLVFGQSPEFGRFPSQSLLSVTATGVLMTRLVSDDLAGWPGSEHRCKSCVPLLRSPRRSSANRGGLLLGTASSGTPKQWHVRPWLLSLKQGHPPPDLPRQHADFGAFALPTTRMLGAKNFMTISLHPRVSPGYPGCRVYWDRPRPWFFPTACQGPCEAAFPLRRAAGGHPALRPHVQARG